MTRVRVGANHITICMGEYNSNMEGGARRGKKYAFSDSGGTRYCLSKKRILVTVKKVDVLEKRRK